ncbi:MAG: ATP-binding protein [Treponema sp.]|nr:ATP-binding protein [Treponema sp.]
MNETNEYYEMIESIKHRDKMLQAVNNAAVLLLSVDENEDIDDSLTKSMELVGSSANADHVYIWRNEIIKGEMHFICAYNWCSDLGKGKKSISIGSKVSYKDMPICESRFIRGEHISSPVSKMPEKEQAFFNAYEIKSILLIPLYLDKQFWGIFSIDDCRNERNFTEEEIAILRSVSLMMVNMINRHSLVAKRTHELALQTTTLMTLFDSIPDIIFTKDSSLRFIHCNKAFLEHFGKKPEDITGEDSEKNLGLPDDLMESFNRNDHEVINKGKTITIEEHVPRFDGTIMLFETSRIPLILDGQIIGMVCIAHDITQRKEMEAAALASSRSKSAFLANMSHEIRTPMNAILGVTELLIQHTTLPDEIEEGLGRIYSSCDMLLGIINDILDFSKIEAGKMDIMSDKYKVADMINDSVHLNMMHINSKPIEFELHIDEKVPAKLIGDELRIKQILNNLLSNAFKYTDEGKVTLSVAAKKISEKEGITLVLGIRDTGRGMSKEQLGRLFEEYSRFDREKNTTVEGTGLGLVITQRLITLMDGEIRVESAPAKGTLFTIYLPQGIVDSDVLGKEVAANFKKFRMSYLARRKRGQIVRNPMPYGSVLIVDDVETNLYVAMGLMKLYRLQIDTAMSGQEAIDKIKSGKVYDIIFMDHMMPEMDGMETAKRLRAMAYNAPIVALTANALVGQSEIFLSNGFDEFISKPIDIRQLNSVLNKLIRDRQSAEVIEAAQIQFSGAEGRVSGVPNVNSLLQESFIRDAQKTIDWLDEHRKNTGFKDEEVLRNFTIKVHGIKSSLWNIGESMLSELAGKLEISGREKDHEQVTASVPDFIKELKAVLKKLDTKRDIYGTDDIDDLHGKLLAIKEKCAVYNRKGTLDIISEIKSYSKETKAVLDRISEFVHHSDFEEAENEAQEYADFLSGTQEGNDSPLFYEEVEGLDIVKGLDRYGGDEKMYIKLLRSYADNVRTMLDVVENFSEDKIGDYRIKVHGIKGISLDIYADKIGHTAAELEEASKNADIDYIKINNTAFVEAAKKMICGIEDMLSRIEGDDQKPVKDKPDDEILLNLYKACKSYEMDEADAAMAEIEKYKYESDDGLAQWLRENLNRMNFSQIVQKLSYLNN